MNRRDSVPVDRRCIACDDREAVWDDLCPWCLAEGIEEALTLADDTARHLVRVANEAAGHLSTDLLGRVHDAVSMSALTRAVKADLDRIGAHEEAGR